MRPRCLSDTAGSRARTLPPASPVPPALRKQKVVGSWTTLRRNHHQPNSEVVYQKTSESDWIKFLSSRDRVWRVGVFLYHSVWRLIAMSWASRLVSFRVFLYQSDTVSIIPFFLVSVRKFFPIGNRLHHSGFVLYISESFFCIIRKHFVSFRSAFLHHPESFLYHSELAGPMLMGFLFRSFIVVLISPIQHSIFTHIIWERTFFLYHSLSSDL